MLDVSMKSMVVHVDVCTYNVSVFGGMYESVCMTVGMLLGRLYGYSWKVVCMYR